MHSFMSVRRSCLCVQANPHNYDAWFDYLRLVESDADPDTVREVYERAISNIPPIQEKRHWRRYIYLWINYGLYEELETRVRNTAVLENSRQVLVNKTLPSSNRTLTGPGRCTRRVWSSSLTRRYASKVGCREGAV